MFKNTNYFDETFESLVQSIRKLVLRNKAYQMGEIAYRDSTRLEKNRWLWLEHEMSPVHNWWLPKYKETHKIRQWGIEWRRDENEPVVVIQITPCKSSELMKNYVFKYNSETSSMWSEEN